MAISEERKEEIKKEIEDKLTTQEGKKLESSLFNHILKQVIKDEENK